MIGALCRLKQSYLPPSCSEEFLQEEGLICASGTAGVQSYEEDDRYKNMFE